MNATPLLQRAWLLTCAALMLVAAGALTEYGVNHAVAGYGYLLGRVALLVSSLFAGVVAWAWARGANHGQVIACLAAVLPLVSVISTTLTIRHVPSGPCAAFLLAALTRVALEVPRASPHPEPSRSPT